MSSGRAHRVLLTRHPAGNARLRERLAGRGLELVEVPLVQLVTLAVELPAPDLGELVVLTSRRAAEEVRRRWGEALLARCEIAVVGGATARALGGLPVALRPERATAQELAALLAPRVAGRRVHLPSAARVTPGLEEILRDAGGEVIRTAVYENRLPAGAAEALARALPIDVVALASASAARRLARLAPGIRAPVVAIGPSTAEAARAAGLEVARVAEPPSLEGLADAVLDALACGR